MKYVVVGIVLVALGIGTGIFLKRNSQDVVVDSTIVRPEQITITLSIDTQDRPLQTYKDVVVAGNNSLADIIQTIAGTQGKEVQFVSVDNQTVIQQIDEYAVTDTRVWQVYINGLSAQADIAQLQLNPNDYVELQYEQYSQLVDEVVGDELVPEEL